MSSQVQGVAGNGRKVNKKLRVPMTIGPISSLFGVLWRYYPATVFEEDETPELLSKRMRSWQHEILVRRRFDVSVLRDVVADLDAEPSHLRAIRCPDLPRVIELCELKAQALTKPKDVALINAERLKIKQLMGKS